MREARSFRLRTNNLRNSLIGSPILASSGTGALADEKSYAWTADYRTHIQPISHPYVVDKEAPMDDAASNYDAVSTYRSSVGTDHIPPGLRESWGGPPASESAGHQSVKADAYGRSTYF